MIGQLKALASAYYLGQGRFSARRNGAELRRLARKEPHVLSYFHDVRDPYAHILLTVLPRLKERYDVEIQSFLCGSPEAWVHPEPAQYTAYRLADARVLAGRAGLTPPGDVPSELHVERAEQAFAAALEEGAFLSRGPSISKALWDAEGQLDSSAPMVRAEPYLADGSRRRQQLGHYLGAMIHYGGEWYWGLDRLHYLEQRLRDLGAERDTGQRGYTFPPDAKSTATHSVPGGEVQFYCSFRSPYTYIVTERIKALCDAKGAILQLRYVLPMVMRGLPVPRMKSQYIALDAAREARRYGIHFGKVCDPLGRPVERGYAVMAHAMEQGRGYEFALSFMRGVWAEGIDAGTDKGLRRLAERSGLDWTACQEALHDEGWRKTAEENRLELTRLGLWGVPSFRVGNVATWGQDRLWVVEEALG